MEIASGCKMLSDLLYRLRALFRRKSMEAELDEELRAHFERQVEKYIQSGLTRQEAARRVRLEFGGLDQVKEECREARGVNFIETMIQDLGYGVRILRKNFGVTAVAVFSLALGIGANIALFSMMNVMLLRALPVRNPQELVEFVRLAPDGNMMGNLEYAMFEQLRQNTSVLSGIFAFWSDTRVLRSPAGSERVWVHEVSGSFFPTLGVKPLLGRAIDPTDDRPDADHQVVVLSFRYWSSQFGRDPSVVGTTVRLNGAPCTVIGVMPADFFGVDPSQYPKMWVPLASDPHPGQVWVLGRLKPGVSIPQARAQLEPLFHQAVESFRDSMKDWREPEREEFLGEKLRLNRATTGTSGLRWDYWEYSNTLKILIGMTGLVLLITCVNVANVLIARSAARAREIGIRLAIGAGRLRIFRQLLTENLLLALMGGAVGLLVAAWAHRVLVALLVNSTQDVALEFRLDERVLGFTLAISILTGLLSGVLPALRAGLWGRVSAAGDSLQFRGANRLPFARNLLTLQVALSLTLLISAGLFVRTLKNLGAADLGLARENLVLMSVDPSLSKRVLDRQRFWKQLTERLATLPGVVSVSLAGDAVFGNGGWNNGIWVRQPDGTENAAQVASNVAGPGFFDTVGIPLFAGREFGAMDQAKSPPVAVMNRAFARRFFGEDNPVGKRFGSAGAGSSGQIEVVGVIGDAKYGGLRQPPTPMFYRPLFQNFEERPYYVHVRMAGNPAAVIAAMRREIQSMDPDISVYDVRTIHEIIDSLLQPDRMFAVLASVFGLLALLLTSIGIYGVVAYQITRRTGEVGIRMALGAQRRDVLWMFMRETLLVVATGAAIGLPAAIAAAYALRSLLFGLQPSDPVTIIWAVVTLAGAGALAGFLPARRAASLLPMDALRHE
jgi:predicted permease